MSHFSILSTKAYASSVGTPSTICEYLTIQSGRPDNQCNDTGVNISNVRLEATWTAVYVKWDTEIAKAEENCSLKVYYQLEYAVVRNGTDTDNWMIACKNITSKECFFKRDCSTLNKSLIYKITATNHHGQILTVSSNQTYFPDFDIKLD
ncbi:uncharacterized protein TRIADDRAFT_59605 [Trichoplax adhaerens]|uniref:Fibronectin type-III domain-containing protein n=1 Tax=Trichoplax adhaerens TaxID=10228 RepID=B3S5G3_TRIAD|nr:predicted protein [Trichoplax adhaerens]EDV21908.1 predicted protein [Trichoplax adhaerens]|eukprot:XP_002115545.1 predicted protein [Trichoplax adhaerens]